MQLLTTNCLLFKFRSISNTVLWYLDYNIGERMLDFVEYWSSIVTGNRLVSCGEARVPCLDCVFTVCGSYCTVVALICDPPWWHHC
jgi:hypothetical protein